jgi:hypothetical protein
MNMRLLCWVLSIAFVVVGTPTAFAVDGTFSGKIADPPANEPVVKGWVFVKGRNQMLRRVEVAHAEVVFGDEVPASERHKCNPDCLSTGQEVRITAHQDASGEWRAKRVEILRVTPPTSETRLKAGTLPNFTRFSASPQVTNPEDLCIASSTGEI